MSALSGAITPSPGVPVAYEKGKPITGLVDGQLPGEENVTVYHSGTAITEDGTLVTAGGRVLGVTAVAKDLRFGAEHEFFTQEGSMKFDPFTRFYGLNFRTVSAVDVVLKYQALEQGAFDAMIVYTTDGLNKRAGLTILADDRGFFPEYNGAILVREDLFSRHRTDTPELEQVLSQLTGQVSSADMVEMTYAVDVEGRDLETVAHDFLVRRGLMT